MTLLSCQSFRILGVRLTEDNVTMKFKNKKIEENFEFIFNESVFKNVGWFLFRQN